MSRAIQALEGHQDRQLPVAVSSALIADGRTWPVAYDLDIPVSWTEDAAPGDVPPAAVRLQPRVRAGLGGSLQAAAASVTNNCALSGSCLKISTRDNGTGAVLENRIILSVAMRLRATASIDRSKSQVG